MRNTRFATVTILSAVALLFIACGDPPDEDIDPVCGDNAISDSEVCDGTDLGGEDCVSQGFIGGTLACSSTCNALDTSGCHNCGDNVISTGEVCDGTDLGGQTCVSQGYLGGTLACDAACESLDTSACVSEHVLPNSPVGEKMAWLIEAVNSSTAPEQAEFETHFSAAFQADCNYSCFLQNYFVPLRQSYRPLLATGWEDTADDYNAWMRFSCAGGAFWARLIMKLDPSDSTITGIGASLSPDLDPAFGPVAVNEMGIFLANSYQAGAHSRGFAVELVDRATGLSFDPPVTGVTDDIYQYVRLEVPAGETEVGVKATHSDGQVTYTYARALKAGAIQLVVPAFPSSAFPYYLDHSGLTLTEGQSQLWGMLQWHGSTETWSTEGFDMGIGCATIESNPTLDEFYYTEPPYYLPTATATQTALQNSTWFAFNADPVAYEFTATATGEPLVVSVPPLAPDAITLVVFEFDLANYPENPTAADCDP